MRAVLLPSYGPPSVLRLADDVPLPALGVHDVLVRVAAAGVNPLDCRVRLPPAAAARSRAQMRAGYARSVFGHLLPLILGREFWRVPPRAPGELTPAPGGELRLHPVHSRHHAREAALQRTEGIMGPYILLPEHKNPQKQKNHAMQKRQDDAQHPEGDQAPACQFPLEGGAKVNHASPHG
jgi:hypothetical protein